MSYPFCPSSAHVLSSFWIVSDEFLTTIAEGVVVGLYRVHCYHISMPSCSCRRKPWNPAKDLLNTITHSREGHKVSGTRWVVSTPWTTWRWVATRSLTALSARVLSRMFCEIITKYLQFHPQGSKTIWHIPLFLHESEAYEDECKGARLHKLNWILPFLLWDYTVDESGFCSTRSTILDGGVWICWWVYDGMYWVRSTVETRSICTVRKQVKHHHLNLAGDIK